MPGRDSKSGGEMWMKNRNTQKEVTTFCLSFFPEPAGVLAVSCDIN
jgi:hypothetical protein